MTVSSTTAPTPTSTPAPAAAKVGSPASASTKPVAKTVKKAAVKPSAASRKANPSSTPSPASRPAEPSPVTAAGKEGKAKKPKLVRDSFTIPKDEYAAIETLKQRCTAMAQPVKKSELLRAGLKVLAAMPDAALRKAVQAVPSIKTGRPKAQQEQAAPAPAAKKLPARQ